MRPRFSLALVRSGAFCAAVATSATWAAPSHAEPPDRAGAALMAGAAAFVAGFAAGGVTLATASGGNAQSNVGWITMQSSFAVAPLVSHAVLGEWARGLALTAPPTAMIGGTIALFQYDSGTILHGSLDEQRVMWTLFGLGLFSGVVGVLDSVIPRARPDRVAIAPSIGPGGIGLAVGGAL